MIEPPRWITPEEAFRYMLIVFGGWFLFTLVTGLWWPVTR